MRYAYWRWVGRVGPGSREEEDGPDIWSQGSLAIGRGLEVPVSGQHEVAGGT